MTITPKVIVPAPYQIKAWCCIASDSSHTEESIQAIIDSGWFTHVFVMVGNRYSSDQIKKDKVLKIFAKLRASRIQWAIGRYLFPSYNTTEVDIIFNREHYLNEYKLLSQERYYYGAHFIVIDPEAYGDSPLRHWMQQSTPPEDYTRLEQTLTGLPRYNFGYPEGSVNTNHCYDLLAKYLMNIKIAHTHTSHDRPLPLLKDKWDMGGLYTGPAPMIWGGYPLFTPQGVKERQSQLITERKYKVMVYPQEGKAEETAILFRDTFRVTNEIKNSD